MLIEGIVDYAGRSKKQFIKTCSYDNSIQSDHWYLGVSGLIRDAYNKVLILSCNNTSKEVKSLSNFASGDLISFEQYKNLLKESDNKLRLSFWFDESNSNLFLSKEIFGSIPLFYFHEPNEFFIFSTSLASLIQKKEIRPFLDIDYRRILAHQTYGVNLNEDSSTSFFSKIRAVVPGHILHVSPEKVNTNSFTHFNINQWSGLSNLEDFGVAVRDTFKKNVFAAVSDESKNIASHLSGGLDSSSVSTMVKHLFPNRQLHTLYHKSESKDMDESFYSKSVSIKIGSIHHEVFQSEEDFELIKLHTALFAQPEISSLSPSLLTTMMPYASSLGCNILLRGNGGDSVIGSGMEILDATFQGKQWDKFSNLLEKRVDYFSLKDENWEYLSHEKKYQIVLQNFLYKQFSHARKMSWQDLLKFYSEVNDALGISKSYFLNRGLGNFLKRLTNRAVNTRISILKDAFVQDIKLSSTKIPLHRAHNLPDKYQSLFDEVFSPRTIFSSEQQFVLSEYYGIASRSPFHDKQLFELCLVIPDEIKYGDGKGREHFRKAMEGLLPQEVLNRSSKATLASSHGQKITFRLYNQAQNFLYDTTRIWEFVDRKLFDEQVRILQNEKIPYSQKVRTWFHITRTISLALWLEWLADIQAK